MKRKIVVLGGGISGLMAARAIEDRGHECILLERCPSLGGLTRTVKVGEFCFDYTGHFLHLNRWKEPADVPFANLSNDQWQRVNRRSFCYVGGRLITAPIQYNLAELPATEFNACVSSYESRPILKRDENTSFRQYIISCFGQYLADLFLIPQNEKTYGTPIDRLSIKTVNRFFPAPNEQLVRNGINGQKESEEYNSRFWYPKQGGIDALVQGLSTGNDNIRVNQEVVEIDLKRRYVSTKAGDSFEYDFLMSSIPLPDLLGMCNDQELLKLASSLTYSSTICINLGIRGDLATPLLDAHWVYVPDPNIPFYRVGCYSNISSGCCSPGHSAMYVEVQIPNDKLHQTDIVNNLEPMVISSLKSLGWLDPDKVIACVTHIIRCAYVHHTPEREKIIDDIFQSLEKNGVCPIGRYGRWDYTSMEDSMVSALETVEEMDL